MSSTSTMRSIREASLPPVGAGYQQSSLCHRDLASPDRIPIGYRRSPIAMSASGASEMGDHESQRMAPLRCRTVHSYPEEAQMDLALEIMDVVDVLPTCHA